VHKAFLLEAQIILAANSATVEWGVWHICFKTI